MLHEDKYYKFISNIEHKLITDYSQNDLAQIISMFAGKVVNHYIEEITKIDRLKDHIEEFHKEVQASFYMIASWEKYQGTPPTKKRLKKRKAERKEDGERCEEDYECGSGFCNEGRCGYQRKPPLEFIEH